MTFFAVVWTTWAYDDKCSILSCPKRWFRFNSRIVKAHFSGIMTLNNWKIAETRSDIFTWRSRFRRRRVCLSSLLKLPYERPTGPGLTWQTMWLAIEGRTVWSRHHGSLFPINIQYPHFLSVVQLPFDNWHSSFSPTTFFEIAVYLRCYSVHCLNRLSCLVFIMTDQMQYYMNSFSYTLKTKRLFLLVVATVSFTKHNGNHS